MNTCQLCTVLKNSGNVLRALSSANLDPLSQDDDTVCDDNAREL